MTVEDPAYNQGTAAADGPDAAAVNYWNEIIVAAGRREEERFNGYQRNIEYLNGKQHDDGVPGLVRTNIMFAAGAKLIPLTYAKDPELSVSPSESVDEQSYLAVKAFAKTLNIVLKRQLIKGAKLKKRMKALLRSIHRTGEGWLKLVYQRQFETDPIIQNRINDGEDNLKRLDKLLADNAKGTECQNYEAQKALLIEQLKALQQQVEVVKAEGIVIDRPLTENILILDDTIQDFDDYIRARAIAERIWFTKDSYEETFGVTPPDEAGPTIFKNPKFGEMAKQAGNRKGLEKSQFVEVFEIWCQADNTVYTMATGCKKWCRPPYQPQRQGERWYPYFRGGFNMIDGQRECAGDADLIKELQDEFNTTRTNFAEHRKECIPTNVVREGGSLLPRDIEKIKNRKRNEIIVVGGNPGIPLDNDIASFEAPEVKPEVYDTSPIRQDIEYMMGYGEADAGTVTRTKTLGEAEILNEGKMNRTGERQDTNEDLIQELAEYSAEVLLQELTLPQVQRIAGRTATWPQLPRSEIHDLVNIEIRAGSTGKPNRNQEREQWMKLMPLIKQTMMEIEQMRAAGAVQLAQQNIELLKETLRRFDERIDLDLFIPPITAQPLAVAGALPGAPPGIAAPGNGAPGGNMGAPALPGPGVGAPSGAAAPTAMVPGGMPPGAPPSGANRMRLIMGGRPA